MANSTENFIIEYEIKPQKKLTLGMSELWQYRELFYFFTWRDIKVKYKQTVLGFVWVILQPFVMMVIFTLVFSQAFSDPKMNLPYPIFVYSGLLLWNIFSSGITSAGNSMVTNANIIKKIYFPRLIIPISSVLVSLFDFFMAFIIYIGMIFYYHVHVTFLKSLVFIPTGIVLTCIATFGLGTLLAALNIKYRDFRYIIPFLVQGLLFLTPVIYPVSIISSKYFWLKYVMACNPMYAPVTIFRGVILSNPLDYQLIGISTISALLFFFIGIYYFRKTESYFADVA